MWLFPTKLHVSHTLPYCNYLFLKTESSKQRNRFFLLFGFGLLSLFGGRRAVIGGASIAGAGALGTVVTSFVSAQKLSTEDKVLVVLN